MAAILSDSHRSGAVLDLRRAGALLLVVAALAAIVVHGKTGRGPKPQIAEIAEMVRFVDRPLAH